jgi:1,4-alpha-glucan branching enzyme
MDVVLALHAHIPYVLHHGRWPHGSTWLAEAAVDSYLPLADSLCALRDEHIPAHFTVGFTPVLAAQLASPALACELEAFLGERIAACDDAPARMIGADRDALLPVAAYWRARWAHALERLRALDGDLLAPFRALEADGRVELMTSAATHALLPLLARDESIHLQLDAGKREHARHFGHRPAGCWLPECGYRPAGEWDPLPAARRKVNRAGLEDHVAAAGFRYFFVGAHVARAGAPPDDYAVPHAFTEARAVRSPYRTYRVSTSPPLHDVHVLPRDPETAMLVWSRNDGYPGNGNYLEYHKRHEWYGLRCWRVTERTSSLDEKQPYDPAQARCAAHRDARDFTHRLAELAASHPTFARGVVTAPFDAELFGHWWHEGGDWLADVARSTTATTARAVRLTTASQHLDRRGRRQAIRLDAGSWGAGGDWRMWLNDATAFAWPRLWRIEDSFWTLAPRARTVGAARPALAQAARAMMLAQSSDWPFIITRGDARDYGMRRLLGHADDAEELLSAIALALEDGEWAPATSLAESLGRRDALFPDVLESVDVALAMANA